MTTGLQAPPGQAARLRFLSLELTSRCQFTCPGHCYAQAGPTQGHGSMTDDHWRRVIDEAAALGAGTVQFIGGEPTLHPSFTSLVHHALGAGLRVRVYSNLYRVRAEHWALYARPDVRLATSYYSDDPAEHDRITGRRGSHDSTRANIREAVRRGIPLRVAVIDRGNGQRAEQARAELLRLGVRDVTVSPVRAVGNAAAPSVLPSTSVLCGRCADGKAAVLPDGQVAVCEIGRFLTGGSAKDGSLAAVLSSPRWRELAASVPRSAGPCPPDCSPNDDSCGPSSGNTCDPADG
ncbi:radical SAM protein [Streptomyces sp. CSDS2]|uniref:radical SAM protein n=1 Tax=Streptomyces sp. CSDS2 TaxID=3055051 RepID=UPI0025AF68E0|nr:radical SAM protein [Streptomyces sp. CSDS2]MDN3260794.1 radical SAM protein [Streptomyces sp. CSDS2]